MLVAEVIKGEERMERRMVKRRCWTMMSQGNCMKFGFMAGFEGSEDD